MRKRISEQNVFPEFNLYQEYRKIEKYLSEVKTIDGIEADYTYEEYFNRFCFKKWNLRGTFFDVYEMRRMLGISKKSISYIDLTDEQLLDFLQYALNILFMVFENVYNNSRYNFYNIETFDMVIANIDYLLERFNCKVSEDEKTKEVFLEYRDDIAAVVGSDYPEIHVSISEYKRIDICGNLTRKSEILCTLYKTLESIEHALKANNFSKIYEDTKFLFNKSGIRHCVEDDKIACETFLKMNENELEEWYDKTFDMFLTCMVLAKYTESIQDIRNLKRVIGDGNETKI